MQALLLPLAQDNLLLRLNPFPELTCVESQRIREHKKLLQRPASERDQYSTSAEARASYRRTPGPQSTQTEIEREVLRSAKTGKGTLWCARASTSAQTLQ